MFSYHVKIINRGKKKENIVRDLRKVTGKFASVVELKAKLMEEFEKQVPSTLNFSVGYFEGCQSTKKWLISTEDLHAMYFAFQQSGKTDILLWCDGVCDEDEVTPARKRKRPNDDCPPTSKVSMLKKKVKLMILLLISRIYMEISTLNLSIDYGLE